MNYLLGKMNKNDVTNSFLPKRDRRDRMFFRSGGIFYELWNQKIRLGLGVSAKRFSSYIDSAGAAEESTNRLTRQK